MACSAAVADFISPSHVLRVLEIYVKSQSEFYPQLCVDMCNLSPQNEGFKKKN